MHEISMRIHWKYCRIHWNFGLDGGNLREFLEAHGVLTVTGGQLGSSWGGAGGGRSRFCYCHGRRLLDLPFMLARCQRRNSREHRKTHIQIDLISKVLIWGALFFFLNFSDSSWFLLGSLAPPVGVFKKPSKITIIADEPLHLAHL